MPIGWQLQYANAVTDGVFKSILSRSAVGLTISEVKILRRDGRVSYSMWLKK